MLRMIFVFSIVLIGIVFSFQGPFYMLLFYLWNAYFRPETWVWSAFYVRMLGLSWYIGVVLLLASMSSLRKLRLNFLAVLILLFVVQSTISFLATEHWAWSKYWWTDFFKVGIITMLIPALVTDKQRYRATLLVIGFSLGLEQAKQGWAQLLLNPGAANNNPNVLLGDNNGVAVGMMMLVPVFVSLAQTATQRWERYLHQFFIVGLVYRGLSTYSRGGFVTALAVGLVALWWSPRKIRALVSVAVLCGIMLTVMPPRFWDRMNTITASEQDRDAGAEGRLYYWRTAVQMANAKPLTGVGFNGFEASFVAYDTARGAWGKVRAVHSAWFGVLAEMGYPGLILFVLVILVALRSSWRIRRQVRGDPANRELKAYASGMLMSLVAFVVGMTFLSGQYFEMFWHFAGLTVALERIAVTVARPATAAAGRAVLIGPASPRIAASRAYAQRMEPHRRP